jgi:ribosomal protein L35
MKLKTNKTLLKRIKIKKTGFFRKSPSINHLRRKKNSKQLNSLLKFKRICSAYTNYIKKLVPYNI